MPIIDIPDPITLTVEVVTDGNGRQLAMFETVSVPARGDILVIGGNPFSVVRRDWDLSAEKPFVTLLAHPTNESGDL